MSPDPPDPALAGPAIPRPARALRQALAWQVTFWSGEVSAAERDDFAHWLAADPAHGRAWAEVARTDDHLQALAGPAAASALRAPPPGRRGPDGARLARRRTLGAVIALAATGLAYTALRRSPAWQEWRADHRTGPGERRQLALADGSRLTLGSATSVDLRFDALTRLVILRAGELFVETAAESAAAAAAAAETAAAPSTRIDGDARPFIVQTDEGAIRALGTRFSVHHDGPTTLVAVQAGAVAIRPIAVAGEAAVELAAGQQARFTRSAVMAAEPADANATAWMRGLLVAERMRLEDFLATLARHRRGFIDCEPAIRELIVSGVYSLDDTDQTLAALARALPVRIETLTRYWVKVRARATAGTEVPGPRTTPGGSA